MEERVSFHMEENLFEELRELRENGYYPFHMPGHKRNRRLAEALGIWDLERNPVEADITEIPGFDDLHETEGLIRRAEEKAAVLYGAKRSFFQLNGSTGAILAAIGGVTKRGDFVLMARNCHKSVYNAVELFGLQPVYLEGKLNELGIYQEVEPPEVEKKLRLIQSKNLNLALVILTSPTYEGVVSDIKKISRLTKKFGTLLFVDEAHGAHFGISDNGYFPETAVRLGADLVVQSLHKTLPSFTQTALLHLGIEEEALIERIRRKINTLHTSSPSYLMMASMEACVEAMQRKGRELFFAYEARLEAFYRRGGKLQNISVFENEEKRDRGKIIISAGNGSGSFLYDYLYEECRLVMEMKSKDYVIAMTSIFDTDEGFERLILALENLDLRLIKLAKEGKVYYTFKKGEILKKKKIPLPKQWGSPSRATSYIEKYGKEYVEPLEAAEGRVAADHVYFYPPGIPIVVAGEIVDTTAIELIQKGKAAGIQLYGGSNGHGIFVCADGEECNGERQHL